MEAERRIMLVAQKAAAKDEPSVSDMFDVGCVSTILQMLKLARRHRQGAGGRPAACLGLLIEDAETHFNATVTPVALLLTKPSRVKLRLCVEQ